MSFLVQTENIVSNIYYSATYTYRQVIFKYFTDLTTEIGGKYSDLGSIHWLIISITKEYYAKHPELYVFGLRAYSEFIKVLHENC